MEVKFSQVVGKEDIYNYNMFFFTKKSKTIYFSYLIGLVALGIAIYSIIKKDYVSSGVWLLLAVYSIILHQFVTKWQIRRMINKKTDFESFVIYVTLDDEGLTYTSDENQTDQKLMWNNVLNIYDYKNYWYIYYSSTRAIFIRKSDCPNTNSVETMLKEKFQNRYKVVKPVK